MKDDTPSIMALPIFFLMFYSLSYAIDYFDLVWKWYWFPTFALLIVIHIILWMLLYVPFSKNK